MVGRAPPPKEHIPTCFPQCRVSPLPFFPLPHESSLKRQFLVPHVCAVSFTSPSLQSEDEQVLQSVSCFFCFWVESGPSRSREKGGRPYTVPGGTRTSRRPYTPSKQETAVPAKPQRLCTVHLLYAGQSPQSATLPNKAILNNSTSSFGSFGPANSNEKDHSLMVRELQGFSPGQHAIQYSLIIINYKIVCPVEKGAQQ